MYRKTTICHDQWNNLYRFSTHLIEKRPIYSIFEKCCQKKCDLLKNSDFWKENQKNQKKMLLIFWHFFASWHWYMSMKYVIYKNDTIVMTSNDLINLHEYFWTKIICPPICKNLCFWTMWFLFDFSHQEFDKIP